MCIFMHISSIEIHKTKAIKSYFSKIAWLFSKTFAELKTRACGLGTSWRIKLRALYYVLKQRVISGVVSTSEKHTVSIFKTLLQIVLNTYETKRCHDPEYYNNKCSQIKLYNSDDRSWKICYRFVRSMKQYRSHDWNTTRWVSLKN
jgi:hypothetical protein